MTNWNLAFDYAACFFLLLILVWYFNERMVPLRSHRAFLVLLVNTLFATVFEIAATWMARNMDTVGYDLFYAVLTLQTLAVNLVPITFTFYLLQLVHLDVLKYPWLHFLFRCAVGANVVILALNLKFRWAFTFENEAYRVSYGCMVLYGIDAVMILVCLITSIRFRKRFQFLRLIPLLFTLFFGVLSGFLQVIAYVPMVNLMLTAVCMTLFHYQQNAGTVTDAVTGQFNRRFMGEYLQNQFLEKKPFGILVIAMDHFKFINKTYGVANGDVLLQQVGSYLNGARASGIVFRLGSDQFCLAIDKNLSKMEVLADQVRERFHQPWYIKGQAGIMMSASLCIIECPKDADTYDALIDVLDYSVSVAKRTKKGGITLAGDIQLSRIRQEKEMEKAVKLALDRDELMVYYQPIFSAQKGVFNSAEALVRLHDEKLGWISPEDFIPLAEKNGLILEMGETVLQKVCRFIRDSRLARTTIEYIEVNISPIQLMQLNFADRVKDILEEYNVKPQQINLEITETATVSASTVIRDNIDQLVDYGITLSLDDFGSGNANLDYINRMPFKLIKIDKDIVWDSFKNQKAGIALEYTVKMLNALELYIVAEGVETEEMKQRLLDVGCHYLQGWYYSKAVPGQEFMKLLEMQQGSA